MKVKTSVTLSPELLAAIDRSCGGKASRSAFLERVAWESIRKAERAARDARDIAIINANAGRLNREAEDVLSMQAAWFAAVEPDDDPGADDEEG
ncbi:MAG: hypothetical protein ACKVT1_06485 [Dehalococcoidia bacterium]